MERIKEAINKIFLYDAQNYIFIYTPPKVGSTTLVTSLRVSLGKSYNVIHIHDDIMLTVVTGFNDITINDIINFLANQGKNIFVIDVYRTPIERKMSEFFEKISPYHFNNNENNISHYSIKRITDRFNKLFPHLAQGEHYFDKYNISEIIIPFDFNKKYTVQVINNVKYVKLRLCDSKIWGELLSNILNSDIVLINDYQTETKQIGGLYQRFKNEYRLPSNYFDLIKECKYINFYYSEDERNKYLNEWQNKLSENCSPYTEAEYDFYVVLYLENQYINDIQTEHYIDNGCYCNLCKSKRREIFFKAKQGERITEKITHVELVNENVQQKNAKLLELVRKKISEKISSKKFKPKQFGIKITNK
jgi:hypothetical protein